MGFKAGLFRFSVTSVSVMVLRLLSQSSVANRLCALAAALALASCADGSASITSPISAKSDPANLGSRVYKLGVGDKLKISIYGEPELSGQLEVNALGNVPMPLIGDVPAKGQSISQIRDAVAARLSEGYLKNPKVSVEVLNYRAFYVHGEVRNSGEFQFKPGLKIRDAIATAGGYTYRANPNFVIVTREGAQELKVPLPSDALVQPGDNIRAPERYF
jgi:protein involved in polysaccharide export with SLBB domain